MDLAHLSTITRFGFPLSLSSLAVVAAAALGTRVGLWNFKLGFIFVMAGMALGVLGTVLCLLALFSSGGLAFVLAIVGIVAGVAASGVPLGISFSARNLPGINDITTDTVDPPQFESLLKERSGYPVPSVYPGEKSAEKQKKAYPEVLPLVLSLNPDDAFRSIVEAAKKEGWQVVRADRAEHILEATATSFWFGFKDDIVIRVRPEGMGSRLDMRSASRVGKNDLGTNAKRITRFLRRLVP